MKLSLSLFFYLLGCFLLLFSNVAAAELTLPQAIKQVERETKGKVLSGETVHNGEQTIHRIKVLTPGGEVRIIQIYADQERQGKSAKS